MEIVKFLKKFQRMCTFYGDCIHCPFINGECLINSPISMTENEMIQFANIVEEWDKEHPVEIDWAKVPADTPVYVYQNKIDRKFPRHFVEYCPDCEKPFRCYSGGQSSWTSNGLTGNWVYCELANEEDKIKYAKSN